MNPMQLKQWLESGVSAEDVDALRECVERYPYFGPLRMMLAKASDQAQDLERRNDLLQAGAHVPSQRALLAYLMGDTLLAEAKAIHAEVLSTDDVTEEDLVHMVWHAQGAPSEAPAPAQPETAAGDVEASGTTQPPASRDELVSAIASVIEHEVQSWEEPTDVEDGSHQALPIQDPKNLRQPIAAGCQCRSRRQGQHPRVCLACGCNSAPRRQGLARLNLPSEAQRP